MRTVRNVERNVATSDGGAAAGFDALRPGQAPLGAQLLRLIGAPHVRTTARAGRLATSGGHALRLRTGGCLAGGGPRAVAGRPGRAVPAPPAVAARAGPPDARRPGVPYWPYDPAYRFEVELAPGEPDVERVVPTSADGDVRQVLVGRLALPAPVGGYARRLVAAPVRRRHLHPGQGRDGEVHLVRRGALPARHGQGRRPRRHDGPPSWSTSTSSTTRPAGTTRSGTVRWRGPATRSPQRSTPASASTRSDGATWAGLSVIPTWKTPSGAPEARTRWRTAIPALGQPHGSVGA